MGAATRIQTGPAPTDELHQRHLARRALQVLAVLGAVALVVLLTPGLGEVRSSLAGANPAWLVLAVALELLCCVSYIAMFHPVFRLASWRTSWRLGWAELGVGAVVPASGASGLALGAWELRRRGMAAGVIARRSVAFFLIKSSVNFVAVAALGAVMALGLLGPDQPVWLTAGPAGLAILAIAGILIVARLGEGRALPPDAAALRRATNAARRATVSGTREAIRIMRSGNALILLGAVGYWAFDNAVLWATFHAIGAPVSLTIVLMGYLIGQLGGLIPVPGGVGGIDIGLIGMLVLFGAPPAATAAAVLAYRLIVFGLPLLGGAAGLAALRNDSKRRARYSAPRQRTRGGTEHGACLSSWSAADAVRKASPGRRGRA